MYSPYKEIGKLLWQKRGIVKDSWTGHFRERQELSRRRMEASQEEGKEHTENVVCAATRYTLHPSSEEARGRGKSRQGRG